MCYSLIMSSKLSESSLAVLGVGKLGGILLRAFLKQGLFVPNRVIATVKHAERAAALAKELGIAVTTDNREAVKGADIVLLTVKPQTVAEVLQEIAPEIGVDALIISVAASVPAGFVEQQLAAAASGKRDQVPVVRAMPNTPAAVHCGMAGDVLLGSLRPGYEIYALYTKRVDERVAKIKELLKQPIDFKSNATVDLSRQKSPWPKNEAEEDKLWQGRIVNELLQEHLSEHPIEPAPQLVSRRYERLAKNVHEQDKDEQMKLYLDALAQAYDPHSEYLSKADMTSASTDAPSAE